MENRQIAGLAAVVTAGFGISLGLVYWMNADRVIDLGNPLVWLYEICFGGPMTDEEMAQMSGNERPTRWLMALGLIGLSIYSMATRKPMVMPSALTETTAEVKQVRTKKSRAAAIVEEAVNGTSPTADDVMAKVSAKIAQPKPVAAKAPAKAARPEPKVVPKPDPAPQPQPAARKSERAPEGTVRPQDVLVLLCKIALVTGGVRAGQLLAPIRNVCGSAPSTVTIDVAMEKAADLSPKRVIAPFRVKLEKKRATRIVQSALSIAWRNGEFSRDALGIIGGLTKALGLTEEEVVAQFKKVAGSRQIRLADPAEPAKQVKTRILNDSDVAPKPMVARVVTSAQDPREADHLRRLRDRAERRRPTRERRPVASRAPAIA